MLIQLVWLGASRVAQRLKFAPILLDVVNSTRDLFCDEIVKQSIHCVGMLAFLTSSQPFHRFNSGKQVILVYNEPKQRRWQRFLERRERVSEEPFLLAQDIQTTEKGRRKDGSFVVLMVCCVYNRLVQPPWQNSHDRLTMLCYSDYLGIPLKLFR